MKLLSTSIYTFENLISGGFLYVDKTAQLAELIRPGFGHYFLARPRRFGKSLLVSTLKAIFQGQRELFAGLAIDGMDYDWKTYPVIHLDLGSCVGKDRAEIETVLIEKLDSLAAGDGYQLTKSSLSGRFEELVENLYRDKGKVVILVDEYDKPLLGHLGESEVKEIQNLLKGFYGVIKTTESFQRFALLTGVSKFSKVSIFSDLNNLTDLTMDRKAATLLGYTQEELERCFVDHLDALGKELNFDREQTLSEMKRWYNGYCFHLSEPTVYNPVSTMKCMNGLEFKNYWFETGTPTFLVDLLKKSPLELDQLSAPENVFSVYDVETLSPLPLLVQTGYLTIKGTQKIGNELYYDLGYPNLEIEHSFSHYLAQGFGQVPVDDMSRAMVRIHRALGKNDIDTMLEELRVFFANIPYDITLKNEKYYQTIFFVVFKLIGAFVEAEVRTERGRIDAVLKTKDHIFILEFKLHDSAQVALAQIREKDYARKYQSEGLLITLVGVGFDPETRNLGEWVMESFSD